MKSAIFSYFIAFLLTFPALAGLSAKREPGQNSAKIFRAQSSFHRESESIDESQIVEWESLEKLNEFFKATRDQRFLLDEKEFSRRITWLYPDDGCFARAALVTQKAQELGLALPNRAFLYGDLEVYTSNSPRYSVTWWYHTAPVVKVKGQVYVLDAAINAERPMSLQEWVDAQVRKGAPKTLVLCSPYTHDPNSPCRDAQVDPGPLALREIRTYLRFERRRQIELKREPLEVLGEQPPWLTKN